MTNESILSYVDDGRDRVRIRTQAEFRFEEILAYLMRSPNECLHHVVDNKVQKLVVLHDLPILLQISSADPHTMELHFPAEVTLPKETVRWAAAEYVWDWFDLATDLSPFCRLSQRDPILQSLIEEYFGLRIVGVPDLFEALCWAIMGQQINLPFAYTLKRRFVEAFGEHKQFDGHVYWLFPAPTTVAELSTSDLTRLQLTTKKAEYLIDVARRMVSGELSKQRLLGLQDFTSAAKMLTSIRGIGPWTANYVLMRCLRDPAAFPVADVGLHNAVKRRLNLDRKPTLSELQTMAKSWKGWEAYATFYLWRSLESQSA